MNQNKRVPKLGKRFFEPEVRIAHFPEVDYKVGTVAANLPTCYTGLMSSDEQKRVKGCGKTGQIFTLYHVSIFDGTARPLAQGFKHLDCGSCVSTFQKATYGIVLCLNCADHLGFPPLPVAKTESAKASRP